MESRHVHRTFVIIELTSGLAVPIFRASLSAGVIASNAKERIFTYTNRDAVRAGGVSKIKIRKMSHGAFRAAESYMITHVRIGTKEWSIVGNWIRTPGGWRFVH